MTLSSCYFCGAAIEEPLSEYPVVPDSLAPGPDEQVTVVLCPSCHRKLSTVIDRVVDAADRRQRTLDGAGADGASSSATETDDGEESAAESAAPGGTPTIEEDAAADLLESDDPLGSESDGDPSGDEPSDDGSEPGADDGPSAVGAADAAAGDASDTGDAPPGGTTAAASDPSDGVTVDDPDRPESSGPGGTADSGRASPADASDAPSQATYNRVVRLLQNREFPVERDEIATVAMNAYDIPPEDFDAVIQTAVNRGVLEEEGPYLKQA